MSLKVWLPLDGDLRNLGCSNIEVTNNGATIDNNGKIGKCYSFTSGKYLQSAIPTNLKTKAISYTCWIYVTSWNNSYDAFMSIANGTGWNTSRATLCRNNTASTLTWNIADGSTSVRVNSITAINLNTWYHVACTYDGTNLKIYINGNLDNSISSTLSIIYAGTFNIGGWSGNNYPINGKLNDVRIYDHCLSAAEVREIAMGLVLHYKLDLPNKNFCIGTNTSDINTNKWSLSMQTGGSTKEIIYDNNIPCVKITRDNTAQSGWRYFQYANLNVSALTPNTTYTISFDMKTSVDGTANIVGFYNGNATNLITTSAINVKNQLIANQWNHIIFRVTTIDPITVSSQVVYMSLSNSLYETGVWMIMKNMKVEIGEKDTPWSPHPNDELFKTLGLDTPIVTDSSGYGHNGVLTGSINMVVDTPRYTCATNFPSGTGVHTQLNLTLSQFTISFWGKHTAINKMLMGSNISPTSINTAWYWYGDNSFKFPGGEFYYSHNAGSVESLLNKWVHFVATYDGAKITIYRNGINEGTKAFTGDQVLEYLSVGNGHSTGYRENGYVSDFRIYCTPLLDNDIKLLYNVGMKVDNLGEVHTFELNEYSNNKIASVQVVNNSATSFTFDKVTNTYTITSPAGTSSWGYGLRFADTPADLIVPYGYSYRWSCDIFTPIAATFISDYNNVPISGSAWAGNDNDLTSQRLSYSISIPANTWTTITLGSSNTHTSNTSHISIRDYSSMGMITNGMSEPLVWKIRNLKWYLVEKEPINSVNKKGQVISNFYNEDSVKKTASISNKSKSFSATEFIEI